MNTTEPTRCYVFDIDGTIADLTHRRHHLESKPKNWPAFNAGCKDDAPIKHIIELMSTLYWLSDIEVVLMSGRNEAMRDATRDWLTKQDIPQMRLYMRADGDYRDDSIVKLELLQRLRVDGFEPIMAFDDRDRVVKMWRENGVPCAQVAPGDF